MTKAVRGPAAAIRDPEIIRIEFETGGPPLPSIRTAPTIALADASWAAGLQPIQEKNSSRTNGGREQTKRLLPFEAVTRNNYFVSR
jgi:hypothetical protein